MASPSQESDEGNVSIEKVSTISKEEGTEMDHPPQATSPPVPTLPQEVGPQLTTMTEVRSMVLDRRYLKKLALV